MPQKKSTNLLYALHSIKPLLELEGTDYFVSNVLWSEVLGVMPPKAGERENQIMELNRRDATEHKIEGINMITHQAESIIQRLNYNDENIQDFTYAIRQLTRYALGDEKATYALTKLKDMYISFMTNYYFQYVKSGKREAAINNLEIFGEEILREDKDLRERLANILANKSLNDQDSSIGNSSHDMSLSKPTDTGITRKNLRGNFREDGGYKCPICGKFMHHIFDKDFHPEPPDDEPSYWLTSCPHVIWGLYIDKDRNDMAFTYVRSDVVQKIVKLIREDPATQYRMETRRIKISKKKISLFLNCQYDETDEIGMLFANLPVNYEQLLPTNTTIYQHLFSENWKIEFAIETISGV